MVVCLSMYNFDGIMFVVGNGKNIAIGSKAEAFPGHVHICVCT